MADGAGPVAHLGPTMHTLQDFILIFLDVFGAILYLLDLHEPFLVRRNWRQLGFLCPRPASKLVFFINKVFLWTFFLFRM